MNLQEDKLLVLITYLIQRLYVFKEQVHLEGFITKYGTLEIQKDTNQQIIDLLLKIIFIHKIVKKLIKIQYLKIKKLENILLGKLKVYGIGKVYLILIQMKYYQRKNNFIIDQNSKFQYFFLISFLFLTFKKFFQKILTSNQYAIIMQKKITAIFKSKTPSSKPSINNRTIEQKNEKELNNLQLQQNISSQDFMSFEEFKDELGSWKTFLKDYVESQKFKDIYNKTTCYPPPKLIFNAFKLADINKLKVVIVGQDPYHQPGQAMGLCFSVPKNIKTPPSLKNIYKCIKEDPKYNNYQIPNHGDLTQWAEQGVFLINALLSVERSKPMSHKDCGWEDFTDNVIKYIAQKKEGVVFMLWGKPAQKKEVLINSTKNKILKTGHPSPLASRCGFKQSKHFSLANEYLKSKNKKEINWNIDNQIYIILLITYIFFQQKIQYKNYLIFFQTFLHYICYTFTLYIQILYIIQIHLFS